MSLHSYLQQTHSTAQTMECHMQVRRHARNLVCQSHEAQGAMQAYDSTTTVCSCDHSRQGADRQQTAW